MCNIALCIKNKAIFCITKNSFIAKCEYCGTLGNQETFYGRSKRFCKVECSRKYSALFQKKNPTANNSASRMVNSISARGKRKIQRPAMRFKKVNLL